MKIKEIRELNAQELEQRLEELREEMFNLRFQLATGQLENIMQIKNCRRNIARVKTVLRERTLR
ncbi:MAG: 50S ribosomal protein L29 [Firmicutes bacterium]|nr:50S ribosomal protein L29 [Bacillota bacterium]